MATIFLLGMALVVGLALCLAVGLVVGLLKLAFRLVVLPFAILGGLLKIVLIVPVVLVGLLILGPVLLGLGAVLIIPVLIFGLGIWLLTHIFAAA